MSSASSTAVNGLASLLDSLTARISALEAAAGVRPAPASAVAVAAAAAGAGVAPSGGDDDVPAAVSAFDGLISKFVDPAASTAAAIAPEVDAMGKAFKQLWLINRRVLLQASKFKKPSAAQLNDLRAEINNAAKPLYDMKKDFKCPFPNHAAGFAEAAAAFVWVTLETSPLDFIIAAKEGAEFYFNKVRTESKANGKAEWMTLVNTVRDSLTALHAFVKENFKLGVTYNGAGGEFRTLSDAEPKAAAAKAVDAAPAPAAAGAGAPAAGGNLQTALFAQLSSIDQSAGRTAGLRHVTKDMKSTGAPAVVPATVAAKAAATAAPRAARDAIPTGTARVALVDKRWMVEYEQEKGKQIHVPTQDGTLNMTQEVYIYACSDVVIFVDSKCKGVRIDRCRNVTVVVQSLLSGVEVVNSFKMKMQVNGQVPSVAIDKTDGIVVGLSWDSRDAQIVTSKSSEMNVTFPVSADADAEWVEMPIPEQFVTKITGPKSLSSSVSELYSH